VKLIQVLGTGCPKCHKLEESTRAAAQQMGLECEIFKVSDINAIMQMGVMMTPALVVDGKVMVSGKVPSVDELKKLLA
jgi:small redox-active disulfide protein 2